jgi:hypothetical protein
MSNRIDSTISSGGGTLAGDVLWLAVIAFVFGIVIGIFG